ncbi:hypothetical protein ZIOFF_045726 [Zingiber officinale]|uniref:Uncharacterized protein n=1 Tax=Zingiber officinale TaxID=94328 RepID=A0A8J5FZP7_ZINOF|nr:hypothetical protein ZIOFF_045726 [Zingiber officinale]
MSSLAALAPRRRLTEKRFRSAAGRSKELFLPIPTLLSTGPTLPPYCGEFRPTFLPPPPPYQLLDIYTQQSYLPPTSSPLPPPYQLPNPRTLRFAFPSCHRLIFAFLLHRHHPTSPPLSTSMLITFLIDSKSIRMF